MTLSHHAPALHAPDLASALDALRARGLRISASRRQVLETLYADAPPADAPRSSPTDGDLASVYRNLDTLEEIGLVRHVHLGHGPGLYSLAGADIEFVTCEHCGAYEAVDPRPAGRRPRTLIERETRLPPALHPLPDRRRLRRMPGGSHAHP